MSYLKIALCLCLAMASTAFGECACQNCQCSAAVSGFSSNASVYASGRGSNRAARKAARHAGSVSVQQSSYSVRGADPCPFGGCR